MKNCYELLGVPRNASAEVIESACQTLLQTHRGQLSGRSKLDIEKTIREVKRARDILCDPERRKLHDYQVWLGCDNTSNKGNSTINDNVKHVQWRKEYLAEKAKEREERLKSQEPLFQVVSIELMGVATDVFIRLGSDNLFIFYQFGLYSHGIHMHTSGIGTELVERLDKVLVNQTIMPKDENYGSSPFYGRFINDFTGMMVAGAGNGLFGHGITKAERFKDSLVRILVSDAGIFNLAIVCHEELVYAAVYDSKTIKCLYP